MGLLDITQKGYNDGTGNKGDYQFVSLDDIISSFMVVYVGENKILTKVSRTDVQFHGMRAIQELSYDVLRSHKAYEIEVGSDGMSNARTAGKLRTALKVIGHYDENGTDIGRIIRDVTPGEAKDIVDKINDIPGVKENSTSPTVWLRKVEL